MSADEATFAYTLAHDGSLTESDIAVAALWFLRETGNSKVGITQVVDFIEGHGIRLSINRSRLKGSLRKRRDVTASDPENLGLTIKTRTQHQDRYESFLTRPIPKIEDNLLVLSDFENSRQYISALARQINGTKQFELFDACAVMMRRLAEVMIIDAYEAKGLRENILVDGNYAMLSGLIGFLRSGTDFKLSRNAPKWLERLKILGDNAAHSRTYLTKKIDIEEFKAEYRNLISELLALST